MTQQSLLPTATTSASSASSGITPFRFESHEVRVVVRDGEPWFVAADVAQALTIGRTDDAVSRLDDDEKGADTIRTPGGDQQMTVINESGLYSLIMTSRKPEAKRFKKWVTAEVLPSIRKTGAYIAPGAAEPARATAVIEDPAVTRLAALRAAGLLSQAGAEVASFHLLGLRPPQALLRAMTPVAATVPAPAPVQLDLVQHPSPARKLRPEHRLGDTLVSRQTLAQSLGVLPEFLTDVLLRHGLLVRSERVLTPGTSRRRYVLTERGYAIGYQPPLAAPQFWQSAAQEALRPLL